MPTSGHNFSLKCSVHKTQPLCITAIENFIFNALLWSREPRASINTPGCGWATETKDIKSGPHPFGAGAYIGSDKALRGKAIWFMRLTT